MTNQSEYYLQRTRAAAKEIELGVPEEAKAKKDIRIEKLFPQIIAYIGDISFEINRGKELQQEDLQKLVFSTKFLTAYININSTEKLNNHYLAMGAVAGYLCDRVGDASLLASMIRINEDQISLLEKSLYAVLQNSQFEITNNGELNGGYLLELTQFIDEYFRAIENGCNVEKSTSDNLRKKIYFLGTDYEVLLIDLLLAVCKQKCLFSRASMIKKNNHIPEDKRSLINQKNAILQEYWPAQRLMAEKGFFDGKSGVIQLPTGAGKTKSIALCIYSYFSSHVKNIAVIVSPFRALCRETANNIKKDLAFDNDIQVVEISDVMKSDYELPTCDEENKNYVVVVTPEKFLYILRREPEFIDYIGQLFFDEGHLFEDETRGANYELLVASILQMIKDDVQVIMISAIVAGIDKVNSWMTNGKGSVISSENVTTTDKYTASLSLTKSFDKWYLYLDYLNDDLSDKEFYVPRFIEMKSVSDTDKRIIFPKDSRDASIATLLRLVKYANCAIFSGKKDDVNAIAKRIVELGDIVDTEILSIRNEIEEQEKICDLIARNYGEESIYYESGKIGAFLHHAGVSDGIKSSIEYALSCGKIGSVICTSTLSQGVNLPIKYLIIDNIYQGSEMISKRDYKNLIGRVGRSGMYTEGTVIYSNYKAYYEKDWRWNRFRSLYVDGEQACFSQLLWGFGYLDGVDLLELIKEYYSGSKEEDLINKLPGKDINEKKDCWVHIKEVLWSVESFLSQWDNANMSDISELVRKTLVYQLVDIEKSKRLEEALIIIYSHLAEQITEPKERFGYSKSLLSLETYNKLRLAVAELEDANELGTDEMFDWCLSLVYAYSNNKSIEKVTKDSMISIAKMWIKGNSYKEIYDFCIDKGYTIKWGKQKRKIKMDNVSAICDSGFSYSATLILNTLYELLLNRGGDYEDLGQKVSEISFQLKYGLNKMIAIALYELGFNDRGVAKDLADLLNVEYVGKQKLHRVLKDNSDRVTTYLCMCPSYFMNRYESILKY